MYARFNQMNPNLDKEGVMVQSNDYISFVWLSIVPVCAWIYAGMYHIFHEIVARIMLTMEDVFTHEDTNSTFQELVNPRLMEIRNLRLDWLHVKTLPKTMWLAEDELGFARIAPYIYGQFYLNVKLRESSNTSSGALLSLRQMVSSMHVMVALLMTPRDPMPDQIDRQLNMFLYCRDRFSHLHYDQEKLHFWANTSNFLSLLNLPAQIA